MICWSYGGGIQSVAIGCLIHQGTLPVPDLAYIADTGRERKTTWAYLHDHMQPFLDPLGLKIQIISHDLSTRDLFDPDGLTLMPAYTEEGRLASFCSGHWKRDVAERWLRLQGVKNGVQWLGFSIDEHRRAKQDHRPWLSLEFPLIDLFINRAMCRTIIAEAGLPIPKKSRCWCCPHQSDAEWQEVRDDPEEWGLALEVEKQINASDPEQSGLMLYQGRVPLEMATFKTGETNEANLCNAGGCWT